MRVDLLPTIVHCPAVIFVGEDYPIRIVQTYYCNCTGADRVMYGMRALSGKLIADLTRDMVSRIEWLPLEDDAPYHPSNGGC